MKWLKKDALPTPIEPGLPDPNNENDIRECKLPADVIATINTEISSVSRKRKRGNYQVYSDETRAKIARYAINNGVMNAVRKFSRELDSPVRESTVRSKKTSYLKEVNRGKENISTLPATRGRPVLLGIELDSQVQSYIRRLRVNGGVVNSTVCIAIARGIILHKNRCLLQEFGGHITLTTIGLCCD